MSSIRIIPSLLYKNGRLVKGKKFDKHIDCGDPVKTCLAFEGQIADEISIIDRPLVFFHFLLQMQLLELLPIHSSPVASQPGHGIPLKSILESALNVN